MFKFEAFKMLKNARHHGVKIGRTVKEIRFSLVAKVAVGVLAICIRCIVCALHHRQGRDRQREMPLKEKWTTHSFCLSRAAQRTKEIFSRRMRFLYIGNVVFYAMLLLSIRRTLLNRNISPCALFYLYRA